MRKFKHKRTGKIAEYLAEADAFFIKSDCVPKWIVENSEDWEEVVEKEYEILSFVCDLEYVNVNLTRNKDGFYGTHNVEEKVLINSGLHHIHSVKRLLDGEIFTIGDLVDFGDKEHHKITSFGDLKGDKNNFWAFYDNKNNYGCNLSCLKNIKQPLFVTEDGKEVFEGDKFWYPNTHVWDVNIIEANANNYHYVVDVNKYKTFSTKDKAEEYILENKPCLSVKDVEEFLNPSKLTWDEIREIAKSKIQ